MDTVTRQVRPAEPRTSRVDAVAHLESGAPRAPSLLNESGKRSPDAIERSLAHADTNASRGICNRGFYWEERIAMHQWWSDYLDQLRPI